MSPRRQAGPAKTAAKRTVLVIGTLFILFYIVLPQVGQQKEAAEALRRVNPLLVLLAIGLEVAALLAYTVLTKVTLPAEPKLALSTLFRIQLATKAVTNTVPGGSAAGGTLGYRLLTEAGVAPTAAGFSLATVGLGSAVVLNLMLWLALLISIPFNGLKPAYVSAAIVGILLLAFAAALVYLLLEGRDRAERVMRTIFRKLPFVEEETASRFVHQIADRLQDLAAQPDLVRRGVIWAAANWLLDAACLWALLWAFGSVVSPVNLIVAYGLAGVLAAIPITPGGLGVVELALPTALIGFGVPGTTATAAVLCWRFAQYWLPIPLGGIAYAPLKLGPLGHKERRLARVRALAAEAGQSAHKRVWDEATGEYRVVGRDPAPGSSPPADEAADDDAAGDDAADSGEPSTNALG
ncbi:flippase-like domain-containing protein [Aquihabitans sp. G128]|uniref:lysylphosphatidylglycerol synthase transmembrane domain-containing protein n=1 Tax=Aquihabitans sp. G128 TaxID=2849779 RepID=UPI001C221F99|nr:YbhN family protein [Aquihabitans sp. G128]QXC60369.1 flippase-like domain-containing protein [Aquihabitans sp. G128]